VKIGIRFLLGAAAVLLGLGSGLAIAACGSSGSSHENGNVTLTVGSGIATEKTMLSELYVQALKAAGFRVKTDFGLGNEAEFPREVLARGQIAGYPEHLNTALELLFGVAPADLPSNAQAAYEEVRAELEKEGLTAFPPTPFSLSNAVGMLKKTADERGLKTLSDLKGQSEEMTLRGPPECRARLDCLAGLERYYGIAFKSFSEADDNGRYEVLEDGEDDSSILYTTDGQLASEGDKFVILEDDKHVFPAGNMVFVTSPKVVEKAGPDFEETIVAVQKSLTLPVMQELRAEVEEGQDMEKLAAQYVKSIGLGG